jgi:hypothetical protein
MALCLFPWCLYASECVPWEDAEDSLRLGVDEFARAIEAQVVLVPRYYTITSNFALVLGKEEVGIHFIAKLGGEI